MSAINDLKSVLCDPEGNVCVQGSDKDREIIQKSLAKIEKQLDLLSLGCIKPEILGGNFFDAFIGDINTGTEKNGE